MRCAPSSCLIAANDLMDEPPPREGEHPGRLSTYRRFWAGASEWEPFILSPWRPGPALPKTKTDAGVYELGISMPQAFSTIVPVYVGMSSNVRNRHLAYAKDGNHIKNFLVPMVNEGYTIWQRVRYLKSGLQAERWEARFLVDYDYAWNAKLNPPKRDVKLEHRDCCCCAIGVDVVASPSESNPSRVLLLAAPLKDCTNYTWSISLIFQIIIAVTIICIVAVQLETRPGGDPTTPGSTQVTSECLLGVDSHGTSLCIYSYVVAGISIMCSIVLGLMVSFTSKKGSGWRGMLEGIISGTVSVWWGVAAIVLTRYSVDANLDDVAGQSWRSAVWALSWTETGLWTMCFLVKVMISLLRCCATKSRPNTGSVEAFYTAAYSPSTGRRSAHYNNNRPGGAYTGAGDVVVDIPPGGFLAEPPPTMPVRMRDSEVPSPTAPMFPGSYPQQQFMTPS